MTQIRIHADFELRYWNHIHRNLKTPKQTKSPNTSLPSRQIPPSSWHVPRDIRTKRRAGHKKNNRKVIRQKRNLDRRPWSTPEERGRGKWENHFFQNFARANSSTCCGAAHVRFSAQRSANDFLLGLWLCLRNFLFIVSWKGVGVRRWEKFANFVFLCWFLFGPGRVVDLGRSLSKL